MYIQVLGVYPIEAPESCHIVELLVGEAESGFDIGAITQETERQPRENWQVPWDEHFLDIEGSMPNEPERDRLLQSEFRVVFFFHFLDLTRPLLSPTGPLPLPPPTSLPERLASLRYELPC